MRILHKLWSRPLACSCGAKPFPVGQAIVFYVLPGCVAAVLRLLRDLRKIGPVTKVSGIGRNRLRRQCMSSACNAMPACGQMVNP